MRGLNKSPGFQDKNSLSIETARAASVALGTIRGHPELSGIGGRLADGVEVGPAEGREVGSWAHPIRARDGQLAVIWGVWAHKEALRGTRTRATRLCTRGQFPETVPECIDGDTTNGDKREARRASHPPCPRTQLDVKSATCRQYLSNERHELSSETAASQ